MTCVVSHGRWPRLFCEDFFHRFSVSTVSSISLENRRLVIDRVRCTRKQRDTWVWFRGTLKMLHVLMEISRIDRALADWSTCSLNFSINFLYTTSPFPILYWYRSKTQCFRYSYSALFREKTKTNCPDAVHLPLLLAHHRGTVVVVHAEVQQRPCSSASSS